ncbi:hypothetical protein [Limnoglobus roseus]|uniref:Uncharacterized protein n=1 Tax=Limnoglobus roseus TaxID=2598579 RepID=A0A5C1A3V7_9BACT|nr:hypothetical protein [Limnoglobus roseus]QEL13759.1 hypothetical protein PX52LOC_00617 [Limnoglobus roseus]
MIESGSEVGQSFAMRRSLKTTVVGCAAVPGLFALLLPLVACWWVANRESFWIDGVLVVASLGYALVAYSVIDYLRDRPTLTVTPDGLTRHLPSFLPGQDRTLSRTDIGAVVRFDFYAPVPYTNPGLPHHLACELKTGERVRLTENEDLATVRAAAEWLVPRLGVPLTIVAVRWGELPSQEKPPYRCRYATTVPPLFRFPWSRVVTGHTVTLTVSLLDLVCESARLGRRDVWRWPLAAVRNVSASLTTESGTAGVGDLNVCVTLSVHLVDGSVTPLVSVKVFGYEQVEELAWVATVLRRQLPGWQA